MSTNLTTGDEISVSPVGFVIATAELTTNSGHKLEIKDIIHQIKIIENLHMKSIIVTMFVYDGINLGAEIKLSGNENIRVSLERLEPSGEEKFLNLNLQISDITNYSEPTPSAQAYTLVCVSKHAYLNNKKLLNKPFNGTARDLIKDIVESNLNSEVDIQDSTNGLMKGIYPNLKPYDAIDWLMRNTSINNTHMYFFESAKNGLVLTSYSHLLKNKDKPFNTYNKNPFFEGTLDNKKPDEIFKEEKNKIRKFNSHMNLSKLTPADQGVYGSVINTIDISTKTTTKHEFDWNESPLNNLLNKFPAVSPEMKILDSDTTLFDLNKSRQYYQSLNENAFNDQPNYHANTDSKGLLKSYTSKKLLQNAIIEIELAGDFDMTPGSIINLETIKHANVAEEIQSDEDFMDEFTGGNYIVEAIEHEFGKNGYLMRVRGTKDSLLTYPIDDLGDG